VWRTRGEFSEERDLDLVDSGTSLGVKVCKRDGRLTRTRYVRRKL
jgi:hypothetical protein